MLHKIFDLRQRVCLQLFAVLLLRGQKLVVARLALLDALYIRRELVRRLDDVVQPLLRLAGQQRLIRAAQLVRQRVQQHVACQILHLPVSALDLLAVVFYRRGQVAGENLGAVVKQRHDRRLVRITGDAHHVAPYHAQRVGDDGDHVAVLLNIFRQRIAHKAPADNVPHAGYICKEIIAHSSLLTFFLDYNTCARIFQPRRTLRVKISRNFSKNCAFMLIFGFTGVKIQFCVENKIRDKSNARELR